jgi:hypothetical protein
MHDRKVKSLIQKLEKQQQQVIALAEPALCRNLLPTIQSYLNELADNPPTDRLKEASAISASIRLMIEETISKRSLQKTIS